MDERGLARPADERTFDELHELGLLDERAHALAVAKIRLSRSWLSWVDNLLLGMGATLLLAGIVFFFAYNWSDLPKAAKLGVIELGMVLSLLGAWWRGLDTSSGRASLVGASVLVGVFLAVFGQVYQTGADLFELFQGWALLILPWTLLGGSAALWIFWWVVANLWLGLFWSQSMVAEWSRHPSSLFLALGLANALAVVAREIGSERGLGFLRASWMRYLFLLTAMACLTIPALVFVVDRSSPPASAVFGAVLLPGAWLALYWYYRHRSPDVAALGGGLLSACAVAVTAIGRAIFEGSDDNDIAGRLLVFGIAVLVVFAAAAFALKTISEAMSGERRV